MARSAAASVALLLLSLTLAGCASDAGSATDDPATHPTSPGPGSPSGGRGGGSTGSSGGSGGGSQGGGNTLHGAGGSVECHRPETNVKVDENATFEGGAHQHDEWGDRTEITIFDGDVVGKSGDWFHPTGAVVYPGTGKVQFVVTWEDAVALVPETRTLQWDMPGDERTTLDMYSHEFESSGDAYELEIGIPNNDPPHYDRTTWAFKIDGASHFTWTIFRGFECLPIDPPHYDAWKGETHRVLFDDTTTHSTTHAGVNSGTFYGFALPKNQTVPEGSGRLVVTMELDNERPIPQPLGLEYCPGISLCVSSYAAVWIRASEYTEETPNTRVYDLVVSPEAWDSPYNPTSTWRFRFFFDSQDPLGATEGYGSFQGTIHWVIEVYKLGS